MTADTAVGVEMVIVGQEETARGMPAADGMAITGEALLLKQVRRGDADAGHRLVREYYPGVYRYLLYLTGRPETAEDLTQETFLQAWRYLDAFEGRASLRTWLHRIAHREFLQFLRRRRHETSLEEVTAVREPSAAAWTDAVEMREVIRRLPLEEREVMVLHYLEGYTSAEIAQIIGAPAGTVRYWLAAARSQLRREIGEGDLVYLNEQSVIMRQWAWLPLEMMSVLEARLSPSPRGEANAGGGPSSRVAADADAGQPPAGQREMDVVDNRLTRKVTLAFKATALSDLCDHLSSETGVSLIAGRSVADEKVTLFCRALPLREVMRQLSRPFGYTWLRSGRPGVYRYELVQDLRSQLLEEELRNRDRNTALLYFEREMERFRAYLDLSPDVALERAKSAPPEEKKLLEQFAGRAWGAIQMYFRLSPQQMAAIHLGQVLEFRLDPGAGECPLPPEVARGALESQRDWRMARSGEQYGLAVDEHGKMRTNAETLPLTAVPGLRGKIGFGIAQTELGQFALHAEIGWQLMDEGGESLNEASTGRNYLTGQIPTVGQPNNAALNARLAGDRSLRSRVSVLPERDPSPGPSPARREEASPDAPPSSAPPRGTALPSPARGGAGGGVPSKRKVTTADVLETLHHATGRPIVADHYTRLYESDAVSVHDQPLFEALHQLADAMRQRWGKEESWLQFRSATFYHDRLREVPNHLLARWAAARERQEFLALHDLVEIAGLSDAQLDGNEMAEGARDLWRLEEWDAARNWNLRPHLRFLTEFTPEQRQEAMSPPGLSFAKMSLAQQQRFLAFALETGGAGSHTDRLAAPLQSLEELTGAALRVDYVQPGWFQWQPQGHVGYPALVPLAPGPQAPLAFVPPARGRTREEALEVARRIDPRLREGLMRIDKEHQADSGLPVEPLVPQERQIVPTKLDLWFVYFLGPANPRPNLTRGLGHHFYQMRKGWE